MIAEFDADELALAAELLELRYGHAVAFELAEAEVPVAPGAAPIACAALFWERRGLQFVVCKIGDSRYRGEAFDAEGGTLGAGKGLEHVDLGDCMDALLRAMRSRRLE